MTWAPIDSAPKDGTRIVCWAPGWEPRFLMWKTNQRIVQAHKRGESGELADHYFGDPDEYDDYDLAEPGNGPTHWHALEEVPDSPYWLVHRTKPTVA